MADFEVALTGDWEIAEKIVNRYSHFVKVLNQRILETVAETYYRRLITHFEKQDLSLAPLASWYAEWKAMHGLDSRILIASGEMLSAIKKGNAKNGEVFVGIKGGRKHKGSGLDVALLALIHEYGSANRGIPARPVFRTTLSELEQILGTLVGEIATEVWNEVMA